MAEEKRIEEEWRVIDDFPNYEVSNLGRVKRTTTYIGTPLHRLLNPFVNQGGFRCVVLSDRGRRGIKRVARLVANAFIPNPKRHTIVFHKDGDLKNDRASNLKWISMKKFFELTGIGNRISEGRKIPVTATDVVTCTTRTFPSLIDAVAWLKVLGGKKDAAPSHICECCRGRIKSAYGYSWEYAEDDEYDGTPEVD